MSDGDVIRAAAVRHHTTADFLLCVCIYLLYRVCPILVFSQMDKSEICAQQYNSVERWLNKGNREESKMTEGRTPKKAPEFVFIKTFSASGRASHAVLACFIWLSCVWGAELILAWPVLSWPHGVCHVCPVHGILYVLLLPNAAFVSKFTS